jgi:cold shock CspA family protein/uncharacterized LabA/DUF88 family protein
VEIAVFSGAYLRSGAYLGLGCLHGEERLGFIPAFQEPPVGNPVRQKFNPLDVVLFFHRMRDRADADGIAPGALFDHRDVLFLGGVGGIFRKNLHGLAAAHGIPGAGIENFYDITADLAFVNFKRLCHKQLLLLNYAIFARPLQEQLDKIIQNPYTPNIMSNNILDLLRIGIFYDGYYFYKVSNYYKYEHPRKSRISLSGLHEFIRNEVAQSTGLDIRQCQIIDAHYFKGRTSAKELGEKVLSERVFEDILMRENIITHYLPLKYNENNVLQEKGIDVWLALEAYELAIYKHFNIVVLVACDGDYVPLVRKLNTLGIQVMLISWDFTYFNENGNAMETRTSRQLLEEVFYPVQMHKKIAEQENEYISNLFVSDRNSDNFQNFNSFNAVKVQNPTNPAAEQEEYLSIINNVNMNGFGFIRDDENKNVFFHYSTLTNKDFSDLQAGMKVKYLREEDEERSKKDGAQRYRAYKVSILDE